MKITLIDRPGATHIESHTVLTTMEHTFKKVSLPRGVPAPPSAPTLYTVYIALKQWNKVKDAIQNPEDLLIVEGVTAYDPEIGGMAVFASNVTTKLLQAFWHLRCGKRIQDVIEMIGVGCRTVQNGVAWYREGVRRSLKAQSGITRLHFT